MKTPKGISRLIEFGLLAILIYTPLIHATKGIATLTATYLLILILNMFWLLKMNPVRGNPTPKGTDAPTSVGTSNGVNWQGRVKFIKTPLNLPLALFFSFTLLSTIFSINKGASLSELYKVAAFILLYFLIINNIRQAPLEAALPKARLRPPWGDLPLTGQEYHFKAIILVIIGVGSIVAGYGVYEYFSHWPNLTEIASTFPPNPNSLAGYLLLIIPLAFALALWSSSNWLSLLAFLTASLAFVSLLATHSRGGYLAFMGSILFFIILAKKEILRRKARLFFLLGILLIIIISLITIQIILKPQPLKVTAQFFTPLEILAKGKADTSGALSPTGLTKVKPYSPVQVTIQEPSDISMGEPITFRSLAFQRTPANKFIIDRLQIWGRTLRIIRDYPFLGTGMGTYDIIFKRHKIPIPLTSETIARYGLSTPFVHNEYLQIAAETGLPSLVIFLWIITIIFRTALKTLRQQNLGSRIQDPKNSELSERSGDPDPFSPRSSGQTPNSRSEAETPTPSLPARRGEHCLIIGLLSGLAGLLLHSFVDFVLRPPATDILFIYFAALIMLQAKRGEQPTSQPANQLTDITGSTDITGQPYPTDSLFHHLYCSPLIRGSLIICITLVLAGQATLPLIAYRHYRKGISYQKKDTFDRAISSYLIAQKLDPTNDQYHKTLGDFYRHLALLSDEEQGFWLEKATEEYEKMVHLSPEDNHYRRDLGVIYWLASQGRDRLLINKAIAQFRESLRIDPTFPFSSCALGVIYAKMGWDDKAIEKFEKAVYSEPNYVEARYNLAILYSKKGLYNKAFSEYKKIIEIEQRNLFPKISCGYEGALLKFDYALAHFQLARLYEMGGRIKEAKAEYEHLLKIRPDFLPAQEALARIGKKGLRGK